MSTTNATEVTLRVLGIGERNGVRMLKTDLFGLSSEMVALLTAVELKRSTVPTLEVWLAYEPFLGLVDALEGEEVRFRVTWSTSPASSSSAPPSAAVTDAPVPSRASLPLLASAAAIPPVTLYYAPTPSLFLGDPRIPCAFAPSAIHRFYKLSKRKDDPSLLWCVGLSSEKKKSRLILLDVAKLCTSTLPIDQHPSQTSWPGSDLYLTCKISKLYVAVPHRENSSPRSFDASFSSSEDEAVLSSPRNSIPSPRHLAGRLKHKIHDYEAEMLQFSPTSQV